MAMDYWIFVFHRWRDIHEAPLSGWHGFRGILDSIHDHIVETTPGIAFETFPRAVPGYNVHMARFTRLPGGEAELPASWAQAGLPWIVLSARTRQEAPATLAHSGFDAALDAEFRYWLRSHLHVLHEPLE